VQYYVFYYHKFVYLLLTYLLNLLIYLLTGVNSTSYYYFVCFTSILFLYAFEYTGLGLGLTVLELS